MSQVTQIKTLDWTRKLLLNDKLKPRRHVSNAITFLNNHPSWAGVLVRNEFSHAEASFGALPPWDEGVRPRRVPETGEPWSDADDTRAVQWLSTVGMDATSTMVAEAVRVVAARNSFHPVRDYFDALTHDGKPRLETWLHGYLGVPDTEYSRNVGRWFLLSAVARIYKPGCKADHALILEGNQGIGKSTALKVLAGEDWFTDELGDLGEKDTAMQLQGRLIVEIAELDALSRAEASRAKAFISRSADKYRPPWGRRVVSVPRQCVFAGTTNADAYLKDATGARRFWPVRCTNIDCDALQRDRDQLWAEAVAEFRAGTQWWPDHASAAVLRDEQESRFDADIWEDEISLWLDGKREKFVGRERVEFSAPNDRTQVTGIEIYRGALGGKTDRCSKPDQMRLAACMHRLGFERGRFCVDGKQVRGWVEAK